MVRKSYSEYMYIDKDNIYTYENSKVLINKFNERNSENLRKIEYRVVASKILKLYHNPILVKNMEDILKIHKFLFEDIYVWAGEYRKVNISKEGKAFISYQSFSMDVHYIEDLITEYYDLGDNRDMIIDSLVKILDNLNYLHPFREGNGRCQREVIRVLALAKNYECDISLIDDEVYNLYMDGTVYSDLEKLKILFDKILIRL